MNEIPVNPIDETNFQKFYKGENKPLAPEDFPTDVFNANPSQLVVPNSKPAEFEDKEHPPGFFETVGNEWKRTNSLYNAGKFLVDSATDENPLADPVPDGWTVWKDESFEGFDQSYWPFLSESKSPKDLQARQERVRKQMFDDNRLADGSMMARLIGGGIGLASSPEGFLLPMAAGLKYATFGQNLLRNTIKAAPTIAAQAGIQDAAAEVNRAGGNMQDAAMNGLRDTIFGVALVGGGAALGHAMTSAQTWNLRKVLNVTHDGNNIHAVVDKNDVVVDWRVYPDPGLNVSAAKTNEAQALVDSSMKLGGVFAMPFVGDKLADLAGNSVFGSPIIKGLRSKYAAVRDFTNRIAAGGPITAAEDVGIARGDSAEDLLGLERAKATAFTQFLRNKFYEANGISGISDTANQLKNLKQTISQSRNITEEEFGKQIRSSIYTGIKSENAQVNEAVIETMRVIDDSAKAYNRAHGLPEDFLPPRTSLNYLFQNYNIDKLITHPESFIEITSTALKQQDELIAKLNGPIIAAKDRVRALEELKSMKTKEGAPEEELKKIRNQLREAKANHKKADLELDKRLQDEQDLQILLEDRNYLTSQESEELQKLLERVTIAENEIAQEKVVIEKLKSKRSSTKSRIKEVIQPEAAAKQSKKFEELEAKIKQSEERMADLIRERDEEKFNLENDAFEGKLNRKFFQQKEGEIKFRDFNEKPKLRAAYESDAERESQAKAWIETITGNSPEQLIGGVLHNMLPGIMERPQYMSKRNIMVPSEIYNQAGYLDNDIAKGVTAYIHTLGRKTAFKRTFAENGDSPGIEGLIRILKEEHDLMKAKILAAKPSKQRDKELLKHDKDLKEATEFMNALHQVYNGSYGGNVNPKLQNFLAMSRNYLAATKLGAVPIAQITDLGAHVLKQGLMPFFKSGLKPLLTSMNGYLEGKDSEAFRQNAAHAYMALNHVQNGYAQQWFNAGSMSDAPVSGVMKTALNFSENLAHTSNNFFGTNFIENMNMRIAANEFQSEVMRAMFDFKAGKMSTLQKQKMARYGIQVEEWADRFIGNYHNSKGWEDMGAYQSQYYNWKDVDATNRMALSIRRAVQDTVVNRGMFTSPLWANNPIMGTVFMFHGWAYGAFNRYTVPIMQRPNAEHTLGIITMVGLGMLTEPLRRFANGKPMYEDDEQWYQSTLKGLNNSGFLGPLPEAMESLNLAFNGALIPQWLQGERYKGGRGRLSAFGPLGGAIDDITNLLGHAATGDITQNDVKKFARLWPYAGALPFRRGISEFVETLNLPEDRKDAQPWSWREPIFGVEK